MFPKNAKFTFEITTISWSQKWLDLNDGVYSSLNTRRASLKGGMNATLWRCDITALFSGSIGGSYGVFYRLCFKMNWSIWLQMTGTKRLSQTQLFVGSHTGTTHQLLGWNTGTFGSIVTTAPNWLPDITKVLVLMHELLDKMCHTRHWLLLYNTVKPV